MRSLSVHWRPIFCRISLALLASFGSAPAAEIVIDCARTNGVIRPLHGVNLGPLCYRGTVDLTAYHRELGVPLTRLHDVVWLNADAVDISTIFRDFRNDPEQPENYTFAATDDYIAAITNTGSQIVYRLGESIEHTPRKYRVHPPADPHKWAAICCGIIRHYNEGWAGGFRHGIQYWEIWNEPDVRPAMWTGNDEKFFQLFEITAKTIKAWFPNLKVGGPALGGTGDFRDGGFRPVPFATNFLAYCRAHQVPLDFLSWHRYTSDPWDLPKRAAAMRKLLDDYGFARAESHFNEWNYLPNDDWKPMLKDGQGTLREQWYREMSGPAGAAFAACGLLLLQDAPLDAANFYTGEIQGFGLFSIHGVPNKNYYAFKAFRQMLDTPQRLEARGRDGQYAVLAGVSADRRRVRVMVSHFRGPERAFTVTAKGLPWRGQTAWELFLVNGQHSLQRVQQGNGAGPDVTVAFDLPRPAVALIEWRAE